VDCESIFATDQKVKAPDLERPFGVKL